MRCLSLVSLAVAVSIAIVGAACAGEEKSRTRTPEPLPRPAACHASNLRIAPDARISAATGQNPVSFRLTNRSATPCVLNGYPRVVFLDDHGTRVPFVINYSGGQMVSSEAPRPVRVLPGRSAFFVLDKYRCDTGSKRAATAVSLRLPGDPTGEPLLVATPDNRSVAFCGRGDPGSRISVSPFAPKLQDAMPRR